MKKLFAVILTVMTLVSVVTPCYAASFTNRTVELNKVVNTVSGPKISWNKLSGSKYYIVYRRNADNKWERIGKVSSDKTSYKDTKVKTKTGNYVYTVKAQNKNKKYSKYSRKGIKANFVATPEINKAVTTYSNYIKLEWNKIKGASGYAIYRKSSSDSNYKRIATVKGGSTVTYYDKTSKKSNTTYVYTIKAYKTINKKNVYSSCYTRGTKELFVGAPKLVSVTSDFDGLKIKWGKVSGSVKYIIYRANSVKGKRGEWKKIDTVSSKKTSYIDKTANDHKSYFYTVRSVAKDGKGSYFVKGIEYKYDGYPTYADACRVRDYCNEYAESLGMIIDPTLNLENSAWDAHDPIRYDTKFDEEAEKKWCKDGIGYCYKVDYQRANRLYFYAYLRVDEECFNIYFCTM